MSERRAIRFYRVGDAFGEFSDFAPYPIEIDGRIWHTSEHYFQSQKFPDETHIEAIRREPSPMIAARMGRSRERPLRPDWESIKEDVMRRAVHEKFQQHEALRELLLSTGDAFIVEHTSNDAYWGDGGDGQGLNRLGEILMEVRDQLLEHRPSTQG
jgi:ribA/ribD-fused uncharacterized protein